MNSEWLPLIINSTLLPGLRFCAHFPIKRSTDKQTFLWGFLALLYYTDNTIYEPFQNLTISSSYSTEISNTEDICVQSSCGEKSVPLWIRDTDFSNSHPIGHLQSLLVL